MIRKSCFPQTDNTFSDQSLNLVAYKRFSHLRLCLTVDADPR